MFKEFVRRCFHRGKIVNILFTMFFTTLLAFSNVSGAVDTPSKKITSANSSTDYHVLIVSDPQAWRTELGGDPNGSSGEANWIFKMIEYYPPYKKIAKNSAFTILNGDLTEFGWEGQLASLQPLFFYAEDFGQVYPGLGNHDYANNVDDCYRNECARRMVYFMRHHSAGHSDVVQDFKCDKGICHGSLSYSWVRGKVKFIQLQNYPTYTRTIDSPSAIHAHHIKITDSLDFLTKQIVDAKERGLAVVINFHDGFDHFIKKTSISDRNTFKKWVTEPEVLAIFVGHTHSAGNRTGQKVEFYGTKPVYDTGAMFKGDLFTLDVNGKCITPKYRKANKNSGDTTLINIYPTVCAN